MSDVTDTPPDVPDDDRILMAEYALGLLGAAQARAVEARMAREPALRRLHSDWAEAFTTMMAGDDVAPPAHLRARIEKRLFDGAAGRRGPGWFGWLGLFATPLAALAVSVVLLQPPAFGPFLHAEMEAAAGARIPGLHFAAGTDGVDLLILRRSGEALPGRVIEVWMILADGVPRSLGVMPAETERWVIPAPEGLARDVVIALSDEPVGGSPTGAPTGEILAAGPLYDI